MYLLHKCENIICRRIQTTLQYGFEARFDKLAPSDLIAQVGVMNFGYSKRHPLLEIRFLCLKLSQGFGQTSVVMVGTPHARASKIETGIPSCGREE